MSDTRPVKIDDGGPAFPTTHDGSGPFPETRRGMSLRDWFAGHALDSLITSANDTRNKDWPVTAPEVARKAYQFADAMLAERAKGGAR